MSSRDDFILSTGLLTVATLTGILSPLLLESYTGALFLVAVFVAVLGLTTYQVCGDGLAEGATATAAGLVGLASLSLSTWIGVPMGYLAWDSWLATPWIGTLVALTTAMAGAATAWWVAESAPEAWQRILTAVILLGLPGYVVLTTGTMLELLDTGAGAIVVLTGALLTALLIAILYDATGVEPPLTVVHGGVTLTGLFLGASVAANNVTGILVLLAAASVQLSSIIHDE